MLHTHSFIHLPPTLYNIFLPLLRFPLSVSFHQCSILIHSFNYHPRCIIFFSHYFSFHCQYHSTNAPYSFIHSSTTHAVQYFSPITSVSPVSIIPPMFHIHSFIHSFNLLPPSLYNVFLPVLHFPLSVSFHQCSILIHSSFTDANNPSNWQTAPFIYPTSTSILPYSLSAVVLAVNSQDRHTAGNLLPKVLTVDI